MEFFIFQKINYQTILISPYDFIKSYIYDYIHNFEDEIKKLNLLHHLVNLESAAIYMAKIMLHNETFSQFKSSTRAVACLSLGFDALRTNSVNLTQDMSYFIKEWVLYLYKIN